VALPSLTSRRKALQAVLSATATITLPANPLAKPNSTATIDVRSFGAKGDGNTDDTVSLIRAHDTGNLVHYPRPPRFYRITKSIAVSNSVSGDQSEIRLTQDGTERTTIFTVSTSKALTISGLVLDGDYHSGEHGEFSHGIALLGASNVRITGNTIRNTYGDCIYVGSRDRRASSENISIENNVLLNPRRCGVAIVCGESITVRKNNFQKVSDYVSAIDIEPNDNGFDYVRSITVSDNSFSVRGYFLLVTTGAKHQSAATTGLAISGNQGLSKFFLRAFSEARVEGLVVKGNTFRSNSPDGQMFNLAGVSRGQIMENKDQTSCSGYRSSQFYDSEITLKDNRLCQ